MRLRVQVLTWGWTDDSNLIHMDSMYELLTSTEFSWMDGKRSKRGYGNIHSRAYSGHVLRFLHVTGMVAMLWCFWQYGWTELWKWCRTMWRHLNLNTETWRFGYFWKMMFDINFWRRTSFSVKFICTWCNLDSKWIWDEFLVRTFLRWSLTSFINSMCMMFFNNLNRMFSQLDCIFVSGSCQMFLPTFSMFLEFDEKMRMDENVFGTTWWTVCEWEEVCGERLFLHAAAAFLQQSRPAGTREVQTCMLHVQDIAG